MNHKAIEKNEQTRSSFHLSVLIFHSLCTSKWKGNAFTNTMKNLKIFMYCWPCSISLYAWNETNLMHCLPSVRSVTMPLYISVLPVAHHQEVTMYICNNWYVLYVLVDCQRTWMGWANWQSIKTYNTYQLSHYCHIVTSRWWATSKPETCRGIVTE
jgi:hypothetical protein